MSAMAMGKDKFVLFPLGERRFALVAETVKELAQPDTLQVFPHTTPLIAGVLHRRGRVVPVLDIAPILLGPKAPPRKFYLIANRSFGETKEWTAVPVTGECELTTAEMLPPTGKLPHYVRGLLSLEDEIVEVIDLDRFASGEVAA